MVVSVADVVAEVWCDVLEVPQAQEEDDFFLSGGDSLLAFTLIAEIQSRLETSLPLEVLVTEGTFDALVRACETSLARREQRTAR
ncbi:phosphopantetheine-binding protein [Streptomyces ossamyceticus]|uniref:phosphopantetheine-binding protein n=1 Tax=Streptomyces ossamyceticus TaxID=249581 RepID=UPI0012FE86C1|nr:phosphopantetheine-binding protein [Streptomyces ossamyceticus]